MLPGRGDISAFTPVEAGSFQIRRNACLHALHTACTPESVRFHKSHPYKLEQNVLVA